MSQAQAIRQDNARAASATSTTPDLAALKDRQQMAWSSGDYAVVGTTLQIVGEELCEALDLRAGQKVLDVAAGNGNVSLAAAHRWCDVTSTDYVPSLLERGRARASAEGLTIKFQEADAEALPFGDGTFDAVVSTFGVMFTPNQNQAAAELLRVCKFGRQDRSRKLDARRLYRTSVQDAWQIHAASGRRKVARALGHTRTSCRIVWFHQSFDPDRAAQLQLPLSFCGSLPGCTQDLLWPGAQGVRGSR